MIIVDRDGKNLRNGSRLGMVKGIEKGIGGKEPAHPGFVHRAMSVEITV